MADGANTGVNRLDLNDAVEAILINEDSPAAPSEDEVTEEVSAEEAAVTESQADSQNVETETETEEVEEEVEADEEEESEEEPEEEESKDAEEASEEEDEPEAEELENETVLFTDSEGNEITVEEAKRGYLRQSDYTKKTQALSEEKQTLSQAAEGLGSERMLLAENLNLALNVVEPQLAELARTDWDSLAANDAYEYAEKRALYDQAQHRYSQLTNTAQALVQQEKANTQAKMQQKLAQEQKSLAMVIPDMADPTKAKALRGNIKEYALSQGLNDMEASNIVDHRMIVMMNKARMFDELSQSGLSAAKKKIAKTPKRVIQKGKTPTKAERTQKTQKEARGRLKQTGSVDDAVNLLLGAM